MRQKWVTYRDTGVSKNISGSYNKFGLIHEISWSLLFSNNITYFNLFTFLHRVHNRYKDIEGG